MSSNAIDMKNQIDVLKHHFPRVHLFWFLSSLKYLGVTFVHMHSPEKYKSGLRAARCIFLGYSPNKKVKCFHLPTFFF